MGTILSNIIVLVTEMSIYKEVMANIESTCCISQENVFSLIYNIQHGLFDSMWRNERPFH